MGQLWPFTITIKFRTNKKVTRDTSHTAAIEIAMHGRQRFTQFWRPVPTIGTRNRCSYCAGFKTPDRL